MYFIYCLDHHFPISILYIYACMQYVYEVLFVPYYTVHAVRTTLYRQRPASQATASHAQAAGHPAQAAASSPPIHVF
jgi:hypothetical protein